MGPWSPTHSPHPPFPAQLSATARKKRSTTSSRTGRNRPTSSSSASSPSPSASPPNLTRRLGSPGRQRLAPRHRIRQSSPRTRLIPRQHLSDGGGLLLVLHGLESVPDAAGGGCGGRGGLCERQPRIDGSTGATLGWTAVRKSFGETSHWQI